MRGHYITLELAIFFIFFQIECINYGQRQAKLSVAATAALKQNVPPLVGQGRATLTHPLVRSRIRLDGQDALWEPNEER